eukprot:g66726.t1
MAGSDDGAESDLLWRALDECAVTSSPLQLAQSIVTVLVRADERNVSSAKFIRKIWPQVERLLVMAKRPELGQTDSEVELLFPVIKRVASSRAFSKPQHDPQVQSNNTTRTAYVKLEVLQQRLQLACQSDPQLRRMCGSLVVTHLREAKDVPQHIERILAVLAQPASAAPLNAPYLRNKVFTEIQKVIDALGIHPDWMPADQSRLLHLFSTACSNQAWSEKQKQTLLKMSTALKAGTFPPPPKERPGRQTAYTRNMTADQEKRPPLPPDQFKTYLSVLTQELWSSHQANQADVAEQRTRQRVYRELEQTLRIVDRRATFELYGSAALGLAGRGSDLDLSVWAPWCAALADEELAKAQTRFLRKFSGLLQRYPGVWKIIPILRARVPLVKVRHVLGISCDVTFSKSFNSAKSKLLKAYLDMDCRVAPLITMIKHWAKQRLIADASKNSFNSFGLTLMVIAALQLQQPPVLPCLQSGSSAMQQVRWLQTTDPSSKQATDGPPPVKSSTDNQLREVVCALPQEAGGDSRFLLENQQDVAFSNLPVHIREALPPRSDFRTDNAQSLGELLFAFFKLFAELNAEKNCVSVRCGVLRPSCKYRLVRKRVSADGQTTTVVYRDYVPPFSIEDPFDPTENVPFDPTDNVARAVADTMAPIISSEFKRAVHLLKAGAPWQEVAEAPAKAPPKEAGRRRRKGGGGGGQSGKNAGCWKWTVVTQISY